MMNKNNNTPSPDRWRLVHTPPASGPWNMAVDSAILAAVGQDRVPPTLRFYRWQPPCLSLGYAQPSGDVDLDRLDRRGWDIVRRPTGGRAILHADELTYAVIGPLDEPRLQGSVLESYQRLSQGLLRGLQELGLPVQVVSDPDQAQDSDQPICFQNPSDFEITVNGKKLIGSAQARKKEGVLQHGTLPLSGDLTRIIQVLAFSNQKEREQAAQRLLTRAANIEMIWDKEITWEEAARALTTGFRKALDLNFEIQGLTDWERDTAHQLISSTYQNPDWTYRI